MLTILIFLSCQGLDPLAFSPDPDPGFSPEQGFESTDTLVDGIPLDLEGLVGPEDIAVGPDGRLYAGYHDGEFGNGGILRMKSDGSEREIFASTGGWVTGLHFDDRGQLLALVIGRGLMRFAPDGSGELLSSEFEGRPFLIPNDVVTDSRGRIYFSVTSHRFGFSPDLALRLILEAGREDGGLYMYDPSTGKTHCLLQGMHFANGVALAPDDSYALLVETGRYRVWKIPLEDGKAAGSPVVFLNNLPGIPNGIALRRDKGSEYWLGFTTRRNSTLDFVHPHPWMKSFVYALPAWVRPAAEPYGLVMLIRDVGDRGKIIASFHDPDGTLVSEASSVEEADGYIYLGGDMTRAIVKVRIPEAYR